MIPLVSWIDPSEVWSWLEHGEIFLVDIRPPDTFCHGHPLGALCVPLSQQNLAARVETATGSRRPVVFLESRESLVEIAEFQLRDAGWSCLGAVIDDATLWEVAGAPWTTIPELPIHALNGAKRVTGKVVLDVREPLEWEMGHVPGALLISLGNLRQEQDRIPRDSAVTVICESGLRSATAASILQTSGFTNVSHVPDGTAGYRKSGRLLQYAEIEQESVK